MKAVRIHEFGSSDKVQVEDVPLPDLEPGYALVRIKAAGVNPVDWMIRENIYNPEGADQVPLTLGQDFAGVVEKIGERSQTAFKPGDEVFGEVWGSFAEFARVPLRDLAYKPKGLDFQTAASIPMPALTAFQSILHTAQAREGMRILVHGGGGAVGSFAVQFAKWKGAWVAATASQVSFDFLRSVGVDLLIDYQSQDFAQEVRDLDVVLDPIGGDVLTRSFQVLKQGGLLINLLGEISEEAARKAGVRGVDFGVEYDVQDLGRIARLVEQGVVRVHISQVLPLEEARKALDLNQANRSHGKIVLVP